MRLWLKGMTVEQAIHYWHGGQRGLSVGDYILPPARTGAPATSDYAKRIAGGEVMRADRVYITTDPDAALMFAAMHPSGGTVYRVDPVGELVHDPDCDTPGLSFECERARILSKRNVTGYEMKKIRRALMGAA